MKTYYTIYQVTNKVNGKIYIGSHKTTNLDDGYMGSGKYLRYAQKKHGIENFEKKILHIFDTAEEMYAKEAELVTVEFIAENNTYNLKQGGFGGWDYVNSTISTEHKTERARAGRRRANKTLEAKYGHNWRSEVSNRGVVRMQEILAEDPDYLKKRAKPKHDSGMFGKVHSDESRKKMSDAQSGKNSAHYGTMWIHSVVEKRNKKIKKTDLIPEGWVKGRKMKF